MNVNFMRGSPLFGIALAAFGALALTPDTLFMRLSEMDSWSMLVWRGLQMGSVMLLIWFFTSNNHRNDVKNLRHFSGLGALFCQIVSGTCFTLAIGETSVAMVLLCLATSPIFAAIFSRILLKEPIFSSTWITMLICFFGVAIAVFDSSNVPILIGQGSGSIVAGVMFSLLASIFLGANFVFLRMNKKISIFLVAGIAGIFSGLIALLIVDTNLLFKGNVFIISITGLLILPISFAAINIATRYTQAPNISLLMLLETIIGPFWVWIGVGEKISIQMMFGGLIVIISLAFYIFHLSRKKS
ncbi:DMT family transporter [Alphaproteobacteria bacterium]|nr:DMT family transporter [Alphaproteobacteria bacterium]MDC0462309.1 DMT family transporter [Alphaproteobacteria bacterium]